MQATKAGEIRALYALVKFRYEGRKSSDSEVDIVQSFIDMYTLLGSSSLCCIENLGEGYIYLGVGDPSLHIHVAYVIQFPLLYKVSPNLPQLLAPTTSTRPHH